MICTFLWTGANWADCGLFSPHCLKVSVVLFENMLPWHRCPSGDGYDVRGGIQRKVEWQISAMQQCYFSPIWELFCLKHYRYDNARAAWVTVGPFHITLDCTFFVAVVVIFEKCNSVVVLCLFFNPTRVKQWDITFDKDAKRDQSIAVRCVTRLHVNKTN